MRPIIALLFAFLLTSALAQPFNWQWSMSDTSTLSTPDVMGFATDALGNSYVTGQFFGSATFGTLPPITSQGLCDVYVAKYDNQGVALWATCAGGSDFDGPYDLAIDGLGNVLITGYFQSPSATFGSTTLTLQGGMDIFVAKLGAVDGSIVWAERFGGPGNSATTEEGKAIACDASGNIYVTGHFRYEVDVPGLPLLEGCGQYYTTFLLKLDTDGNGLWIRRPECGHQWIYSASEGEALTVGEDQFLYLGLRARGDTVFLETDTLLNDVTTGSTHDGVVVKYDLDGAYQWSRIIGGYGYDDVQGVQADIDGNVYVAMHREGDYGSLGVPGIALAGNLGIYRNVILKMDQGGNIIWGMRIGNSTYDHDIEAMRLESQDHLLVAGWHQGNFEIGGVTPNPGTTGTYGLFLARFDSSSVLTDLYASRYQYARGIRGIDLDDGGNIYIAGYFQDSLALPGLPVMDVGAGAMFLARSGDFPTVVMAAGPNGAQAYPVPSRGRFSILAEKPFTGLRIVNAVGSVVMQRAFAATTTTEMELEQEGVYFYTLLNSGRTVANGRVLVVH